ncbi:MAG: hypothetical protein WA208_12150, partial [Thermoanaerobaculia bacterium]
LEAAPQAEPAVEEEQAAAPPAEAPAVEEPHEQAAEPDIDFSQADAEKEPPVKTVKVRSSIDVMAELEALRKRATQGVPTTKPARKNISLADLGIAKPKKDLQRTLHLTIPPDALPRAHSVRVTLTFEDSEQETIEVRDHHLELGDTSDAQSLTVNLKIDLA